MDLRGVLVQLTRHMYRAFIFDAGVSFKMIFTFFTLNKIMIKKNLGELR